MRTSAPQSPRPLAVRIARAIGRGIVTIAVLAYTILDQLLFPLVRPLLRRLGRLRLFETIGTTIGRLPPYVVLVLLGVPFVLIEPVKVFAIYWGAEGHIVQGMLLLIAAQILSILTCDRIYHAGHAPLMRIGWFKKLMGWLIGLKDRALGWAKSTAAWQAGSGMAASVRLWFAGVFASLR